MAETSSTEAAAGLLGKVVSLTRLLGLTGAAARRNLRMAIVLTTLATLADFSAL